MATESIARLEAIAEPGGICVTRGVRDHLRDKMDYEFDDLGEHKVKNISRPVRVFQVIFDPHGTTNLGLAESDVPKSPDDGALNGGEETEAVELAFWQSVEGSDDPAEYRAYLQRFPEGAFVSLALARAEKSETTDSNGDPSVELEFWNSIKDSELREMFEAYLNKYPDGEFRTLAEIRLKGTLG